MARPGSREWNRTSLIGIVSSIGVGAALAVAGSSASTEAGGVSVFVVCGLVAFGINLLAYVPAILLKTERFFDATGSVTYVTVAIVALVLTEGVDTRAIIVTTMVIVWAVRLGSFLFARIRRDGRDGRFDTIRTDPLRFLMMWMVQGLWVFLTLACALAIITTTNRADVDAFAIVGLLVWAVGFAIEVVADEQKSRFRRDPANHETFITTGLWSWSRHPNYFGEITLWTGVAIVALPVLSGWAWVTLISPVFVSVLLTRISGVALLERRAHKRWGDDEAFRTYTANTPTLILRPPK
jgi:steroid 5-alpha reductase family enzyme